MLEFQLNEMRCLKTINMFSYSPSASVSDKLFKIIVNILQRSARTLLNISFSGTFIIERFKAY